MKLSELTYDYLLSVGLPEASMHTDASDELRVLYNAYQVEQAKEELSAKYGDVDLIIDPEAVWYARIRIDNQKWQEDHEDYCRRKGEWCRRNTAE